MLAIFFVTAPTYWRVCTAIESQSGVTTVCVDPSDIKVFTGDNFTLSVSISNVQCLYGLDIQFSWDPTIIKYIEHTVSMPVEDFPNGVLHGPALKIEDEVNESGITGAEPGTLYWVAYTSMYPAQEFNGSGNVFTMTFRALKSGICNLRLTSTSLSDRTAKSIPHNVNDGRFECISEDDVAVFLQAPTHIALGTSVYLIATIFNKGVNDKMNVELQLEINGSQVNSTIIDLLRANTSSLLTHQWTPTVEGMYNITAYAPAVEGETYIEDNVAKGNVLVEPPLPLPKPIVFVDPPLTYATIGKTITVSIKIRDIENLYGLHIVLWWNPDILKYINHTVTMPVEDYSDGLLHEPVQMIEDDINELVAFCSIAYASVHSAPAFEGNGTIFRITFKLINSGISELRFLSTSLNDANGQLITHNSVDGSAKGSGGQYFGPSSTRDVGIVNMMLYPNTVYARRSVNITVLAVNNGDENETFNIAVYSNLNIIETLTVSDLAPRQSITKTFTWNNTHLSPGENYVLWAKATTAHGEKDFGNNRFSQGIFKARMLGDVNGDGSINIYDIVQACASYASTTGDSNWDSDADLAPMYGIINIYDIVTVLLNYGKIYS
jgi:hypothetical protein